MRKLLLELIRNDTATAAAKAESDIVQFLKSDGFMGRYYDLDIARLVKYIFESYILRKKVKDITNKDVLFFQYTLYGKNTLAKWLSFVTSNKYKILLIHDITSLREQLSPLEIKKELSLFDKVDCIIAHNDSMVKWLREHNVTVPIISLEIFDYAQHVELKSREIRDYKTIVFAGNLEKSEFLFKMIPSYKVYLYGPVSSKITFHDNISYLGIKSADEIPSEMTQYGFGLIWDGPSLDSCQGQFGDYMKFNNPHKTSLYLSSGVPVIIWKEAALAEFIKKNNVGFVIDSLDDIDDLMDNLSEEDYYKMRVNAEELGKKLRNGYYTLKAVRHAIDLVQK